MQNGGGEREHGHTPLDNSAGSVAWFLPVCSPVVGNPCFSESFHLVFHHPYFLLPSTFHRFSLEVVQA